MTSASRSIRKWNQRCNAVARMEAELRASEQRWRLLFEQSPLSTQFFSPDGRSLRVNRAWEQLFGVPHEALADYNVLRDPQLSAHGVMPLIERAFAGEAVRLPPIPFELQLRPDQASSGRKWVGAVMFPLLDEAGRVTEVVCVHEDFTERKRVEEESEAGRRRREGIQQATYRISEAVLSAQDLQSLYARVHETVAGLMPARNFYIAVYDPKTELFTFPYFVDEHDLPPGPRKLNSGLTGYVIRTGKALLVNSRTPIQKLPSGLAVLAGETIYVEHGTPSAVWLGAPLRIRGQSVGVIAVQDYQSDSAYGEDEKQLLTFIAEQTAMAIERKKAETDLLKALEQEKELGRLKSNFVSLVSHEFRTPLGIIMSSAEILRDYLDSLDPAERADHLESIQKSTRRMANLMEEVLLLGRFDAGRMEFKPDLLDFGALCRRMIDEVGSATAQACPIELRMAAPCQDARGDERLLRHIFTNLLSNAVKYSDPGKAVVFEIAREAGDAICRIHDQGIGIPEHDLPWLFRPFYRGRNVGQRPGSGLGLVLVKRCVEMHDGQISVQSAPGEGTTFTLRLPLFEGSVPLPKPFGDSERVSTSEELHI